MAGPYFGQQTQNVQPRQRPYRPIVVAALALILLVISYFISSLSNNNHSSNIASRLPKPGTAYRGKTWHTSQTISVETLGETAFAKCDIHTVLSEDGKSTIDDWLFLEEVNAVNIIVQTIDNQFVVFNQYKYAIPGSTLSPVGGFIDEGESPLTSAKREVLEELGLGSKNTAQLIKEKKGNNKNLYLDAQSISNLIVNDANVNDPPILDDYGLLDGQIKRATDDTDWVYLGRYRTAANRGGGFLYSYLLKNAIPLVPNGGTTKYQGSGDNEKQEIQYLSEEEVMDALSKARFQEVKWAATFALAMLHIKNGMPPCCGDG